MSIYVGSTEITEIKIGSTEINEVWVGSNKVWSSSLDTQTVTVGYKAAADPTYAGPWYGFSDVSPTFSFGSVSDGICKWESGSNYISLYAQNPTIYGGSWILKIGIDDTTPTNSGWTTVSVGGGTAHARTSFNYSTDPGGVTSWTKNVGTTAPFGTTVGATVDVVFN